VKEGDGYSFYSNGGSSARFALHIMQDGQQSNPNAALVYAAGNQLEIRLQGSEGAQVEVRDLSGRQLDSFSFEGISNSRRMNLPAGAYTVTLRNGSVFSTQKVLLNNN
jgi:hypothetical protein